MRKMLIILNIGAIVNLLALGGLVGWLVTSGRLDQDRARAIRKMLSETIAQQQMREEKEQAEADASDAQTAPPDMALSASEIVSMRLDRIDADRERKRLLEQQASDLSSALSQREKTLASEKTAFEKARAEYEKDLDRIRTTDGDRQFRKAVKVIEGLKPKESAKLITSLIETDVDDADGSATQTATGVQRAVSYLNAMQERARLKLMSELTKTKPALAADLLERLRTRGVPADQFAKTP